MSATLVWATPNGDQLIGNMARVSNPNAKPDDDASKLIAFLIRHRHWSPFEMVSMCVEIKTTRDIGRQILRHRSFSFQEFSQRYAEVKATAAIREARLKGTTNRQGSLDDRDKEAEKFMVQTALVCFKAYESMILAGIAPECARVILPEGFTPTKMYMTGTVRSWIHYLEQRTDEHTQKEHRVIAKEISQIFWETFPDTFMAVHPA
jgi:thymidylate synthase (FAD)